MTLTRKQTALIHVAKTQLALSDERYRFILREMAGVESAKDLDRTGFEYVMKAMMALGFRSDFTKTFYTHWAGMATPAQVTRIRALWRDFATVDDSENALNKWLERTFKVSALRFATEEQAAKATRALRSMNRKAKARGAQHRAGARRRMSAGPTIAAILRHVAAHYGFRASDLISARKARDVTRARHVAMCLCRRLTPRPAAEIGRHFGNRDRKTVTNAWERTEEAHGGRSAPEGGGRSLGRHNRSIRKRSVCRRRGLAGPCPGNARPGPARRARSRSPAHHGRCHAGGGRDRRAGGPGDGSAASRISAIASECDKAALRYGRGFQACMVQRLCIGPAAALPRRTGMASPAAAGRVLYRVLSLANLLIFNKTVLGSHGCYEMGLDFSISLTSCPFRGPSMSPI